MRAAGEGLRELAEAADVIEGMPPSKDKANALLQVIGALSIEKEILVHGYFGTQKLMAPVPEEEQH